jgi:hypothetical protein
MMAAAVIATGFALICSLVAIACVYACFKSVKECDAIERALRQAIGRIAALEHEQAVIASHVHKLRQKIYSTKSEEKAIEIANATATLATCENYSAAQREGPQSQAAKCDCAFCEAKRAERDALRVKLVPKRAEKTDARRS